MKILAHLKNPLHQIITRIITLEHNSMILAKCHKSNKELTAPTRLLNLPKKTISGQNEISKKECQFILLATDSDQTFKQKFTQKYVFEVFTKQELSDLFAIKREKKQQNISCIGVLDTKQVQHEWNLLKEAIDSKFSDAQVEFNFVFKEKKQRQKVLFNPFKKIKKFVYSAQQASNLKLLNKLSVVGFYPQEIDGICFDLDFKLKKSEEMIFNLTENEKLVVESKFYQQQNDLVLAKLNSSKHGYGYGKLLLGFLIQFLIDNTEFENIISEKSDWLENLGFTGMSDGQGSILNLGSQRGDIFD